MAKTNKPKPTPKATKAKKYNKKTTRRRRKVSAVTIDPKTLCDLDQIYRAINRVQMLREDTTFLVSNNDSIIVDNILNDLTLKFNKKSRKLGKDTCTEYTVKPSPEVTIEQSFDELEEFPDELLEDGQIFFG